MQVDVTLINILLAREMKKKCNTICRQVESTRETRRNKELAEESPSCLFFDARTAAEPSFKLVHRSARARSILCTYVRYVVAAELFQ